MDTVKFNLSEHTHHILKIADHNKCSATAALGMFITNLAVMRDCYHGAPDLNFHQLGQQWNSLSGSDRNIQKAEVAARLSRYNKTGGNN